MAAVFPSNWSGSVSAAELVRNFAECREAAARKHLHVTHHGRATHVLLGIDAYNELKDAADAEKNKTFPDSILVYTLADWLDAGLILCDAAMSILFVNRVGQAITRTPSHELIGKPLFEALPQTAGSLWETHARRTVNGGEFSAVDLPSPFQKDGWLHFQSFPLGHWNALLFHDITDDMKRDRLADVKEAMLDAMGLHGDIYYARLSVRGTIDRVNNPCRQLIGLSDERLQGVALADLIVTPERARFREALESVLRGDGDRKLETRILTNEGHVAPLQLSLVQLQGAYGGEGAVMLATAGVED